MTKVDSHMSVRILQALDDATESLQRVKREKHEPIAIVGLSCRFPGANSPEEFWQNLKEGVDSIREVPTNRWDLQRHYQAGQSSPGKMYCRHGGFVEDIRGFDASLFRVSPREAVSMDPQQRILLELTWEALERAGMNPRSLKGSSTSVHVGVTTQDYKELLLAVPDANSIDTYFASGNAPNAIAGRLSYALGLNGPSMVVDTACSSSLVAVHLACQGLRSRESDLAIAGGANLILSPQLQIALCQANMLSASGRCRTFSADADGYVRGEGCGVLILKRLSDAQRDNDLILAQIRGSAVNQDGASSGFTVPNGPAQEAVIRKAIGVSNLAPRDVDYLEAHGTGTPLGDPIEINAAARVYGENRDPKQPLLLGSVKTNVGHLEAAAGLAGLIKIIMALKAKSLPAHLHFTEPNPNISWDKLPVRVTDSTAPWVERGKTRIAAISSFGASGTNAHVIIEEAPQEPESTNRTTDNREEVLVLSADSSEALRDLAQAYHDYLRDHPSVSISDFCYTTTLCRAPLRFRRSVWGSSTAELQDRLARSLAGESGLGIASGTIGSGKSAIPIQQSGDLTAESAGRQFVEGVNVPWEQLYPKRRPLRIPTYPFQHQHYWAPVTEASEPLNDILYRSEWEPYEEHSVNGTTDDSNWILVSDDPLKTEALAHTLTARRQTFTCVRNEPGTSSAGKDQPHEKALADLLLQTPGDESIRILYFPEMGHCSEEDTGKMLADETTKICQQTINLFLTVEGLSRDGDTRIWVVTQDSQPVQQGNDQPQSRLMGSSVWGLVRTIATEHTDSFGGLLDIGSAPGDETADRVIDQVLAGTPQLSLHEGKTFVPRIRPISPSAQHDPSGSLVRPDATYLITGGLGALGIQVAQWLANNGAKEMVLLSRRGERPGTFGLDTIRSLGADVWAPAVDVAQTQEIEAVVDEIQGNRLPLKGVFHLAGVLDDKIVARLDAACLDRVIKPKVAGGWNLHVATRDLQLDHFVLFSSMASWMGPAGQGNYAAANAFLDALSRHRRAKGQPSTAISWGPWSGSGMWDSLDLAQRSHANKSGIHPLAPDEALRALGTVLLNDIPEAIAARVDWQQMFSTGRPAFLRTWADQHKTSTAQPVSSKDMLPHDTLLQFAPEVLEQELADTLAGMLADILRLDSTESIDRQMPLDDYGMDSLTATELKNKLASRLRIVLPVSQFIGGRSVNDLVDILRANLIADDTSDGTALSENDDQETVEILI